MQPDPNASRPSSARSSRTERRDYDVVVCGAGSSGSVVAGRLAEDPSIRVLLLEAGPTDERENVLDPSLWPTNFGTEGVWNYVAEPSEQLGGRAIPFTMGRGLGGGGSVNVTVWSRGHRSDWNSYADVAGDAAWDYDHILDVYRRIEDYHGEPDPRRGVGGPMWIEQLHPDHPFHEAATDAAVEAGYPLRPSMNGELMEESAGTSPRDADVHDGRRQSPYRSYVHPKRSQPNLTVLTGATVAEILFDGSRASGVRLADGRTFEATQVVLSLGAINTPAVLLRSGIGDPSELARLGIPVRHALPGVGRNLHDHAVVASIWEARDGAELPPPRALNGVHWNLEEPGGRAVVLYIETVVTPSQTVASRHPVPERGATFITSVRLRSRGRVTLADRDAAEPRIEPGYYTDPGDRAAVAEIVRRVAEIGDAPSLRPFLAGRVLPPAGADAEAIDAYLTEATDTSWHQCGTAAMGTGELSVVDSRLRVHGLDGLRVVDASVLPHAPVGNTMAPSVVVGEQGAAFLREELLAARV